ncbi:penicillin-binding protein activator [Vibrio maerlii]|uniref:penicillin-binding protein activator n=1 Tax=Vibrio maerlii TaxID=2231648 RepID=UPI000E3D2B32|nr:penicillin-binding protein activator [Vibrio maerlii]
MMNQKRISVPRLLTPIALAITLAACSSKPPMPTYVDITLDPAQSSQEYLIRADSSQGSLQNDWLIMALKAAVDSNNVQQAELLIKRIAKQQLSEMQQAEWLLAQAELMFNTGNASQAVSKLNFQSFWQLPQEQWKDYYALRATMLESLNRYYEAASARDSLMQYMEEQDKQENSDTIWSHLAFYSSQELSRLKQAEGNRSMQGWAELAISMKTLNNNLSELQDRLSTWLVENPSHNAALYTPQGIQEILALEITKPQHTALLLPLTGKFAQQAQLVRDGYIFAMMNDTERDPEATLTVIDSNASTPDEIRATVKERQIDFVVGPLIKSNIEKFQQAQANRPADQQLPALALNIPNEVVPNTGLCYFTLSPEQEVAQAAKHLFEKGYKYPLVFAPSGSYGSRVATAFEQEWELYSRNPVAINYFGNKRQLQKNIDQVFALQESNSRINQMNQITGLDLEATPRSRRDVDAVYIIAKSSELTLIKPFIEVAVNPDAKPPKLFSNSRSNSGANQYEDLTGVEFSDIPLLINGKATLVSQMDELWPNNSLGKKRLQALGMDAYTLVDELPQMKLSPEYQIQGQTGKLSVDDQCVIQREVDWAEHGAL